MTNTVTSENAQKATKEGGPTATATATETKSLLGTKKRASKPAYL